MVSKQNLRNFIIVECYLQLYIKSSKIFSCLKILPGIVSHYLNCGRRSVGSTRNSSQTRLFPGWLEQHVLRSLQPSCDADIFQEVLFVSKRERVHGVQNVEWDTQWREDSARGGTGLFAASFFPNVWRLGQRFGYQRDIVSNFVRPDPSTQNFKLYAFE